MAVKSETLPGRNQDPFTPEDINFIREKNIYARYEQPPARKFPITVVDLEDELNLVPGQKTANGMIYRKPHPLKLK